MAARLRRPCSTRRAEILSRFAGISVVPSLVLGTWLHQDGRYEEELVRWFVDVEDTPENRQFFRDWKAILLQRFQQLEIYIVSYPIERV